MSRLGRWIPVATVVALLGAAMLAAVFANPTFESRSGPAAPFEAPSPSPLMPSMPADARSSLMPEEPGTVFPSWVGTLITALCAAVGVALVLGLLWLMLRDRLMVRKAVPKVADAEELHRRLQERVRAAVDEGLADLDVADRDPRRAVIACWVRLEAAAAAAGTEREPGDTSTELVERLLAEHAVTASVLAGFAAVYREARFATHVVDETMREQARAALRQVRDELPYRRSTSAQPPELLGRHLHAAAGDELHALHPHPTTRDEFHALHPHPTTRDEHLRGTPTGSAP